MDYIDIPRSLIYKERTDLKDFGVQAGETVNGQLFSNLKGLFRASDKAKELILRCFNNAYYICTLIPFEDFPETQVAEYEKLLLKEKSYDCEEVCAVSMAMVCKLLSACDAKWRSESNDLIKNIQYRFTHFQWMHTGARKSFEFMMDRRNTDLYFLPKNEFAPRDIIDAIENVGVNDLAIGVKYVCNKLALLDDQRIRMYGADLAIAHLRDDLREIYEDWGYDPKTKKFDPEMEDPVGDYIQDLQFFNKATKFKEEAVEYLLDHYPTEKINTNEQAVNIPQKPETDEQNTKIIELESNLSTLSRQLMKAHKIIEEFRQPVEELTAEQKVRMAFALKLLEAAGLKDDKLDKNKSKVATIMSLLTGISSKKSGTQVCQNYLIDQKYYPRKENMDTLIRLNTLCSDLGINVCLGLESQGNK